MNMMMQHAGKGGETMDAFSSTNLTALAIFGVIMVVAVVVSVIFARRICR